MDAIAVLKKELLPMADIITPNIPESEVLAEMQIRNPEDMIKPPKKSKNIWHGSSVQRQSHHE